MILEATTFDAYNPTHTSGAHLGFAPLLNTLVRFDRQTHTKIQPSLAESWTVSSDGRTYTLKLRQGVKWHDGTEFKAEDVVYTLQRVVNPPLGVLIGGPVPPLLAAIKQVDGVGDYQVNITLAFPEAGFLNKLGFTGVVIYPKRVLEPLDKEKKPLLEKDLVGTGPFVLKSHDSGILWDLVSNPGYWDKDEAQRPLPYLNEIKTFIIVDDAAGFAAFRTKQILQSKGADRGIRPESLSVVKGELASRVKTFVFPGISSQAIRNFNHAKFPWNDVRARQALYLGIDRQALMRFYDLGNTELTTIGAPMDPKGEWGIPEQDLLKLPGLRSNKDEDLRRAKELLAAAGVPQGFQVSVLAATGVSATIATGMADQLRNLGLNPKIEAVSFAERTRRTLAGDFDIISTGRAESIDEPTAILNPQFRTGGIENFGRFSSTKLDDLLDRQQRELDPAKRMSLVKDAQAVMMDEVPTVNYFWFQYVNGIYNEVQNLTFGPGIWGNYMDYDRVWIQTS